MNSDVPTSINLTVTSNDLSESTLDSTVSHSSHVTSATSLSENTCGAPLTASQLTDSCDLRTPVTTFRNAMLARQSSFDHGGEGQISSTQVKQRLKTYLLNRRRQANTNAERRRRSDDRSTTMIQAVGAQHHASQGSDPGPSLAGHQNLSSSGGGGFWDSADSANSFDSDWNEAMTSDRPFQQTSFNGQVDGPSEMCSVTSTLLLQLAEIFSRSDHFSAHPTVLNQLRQHMLLIYAKALGDSAKASEGQFRSDLRKTISEPDLVETTYPWPLRLVSHLLHQTTSSATSTTNTPTTTTTTQPDRSADVNSNEFWATSATTTAIPSDTTPATSAAVSSSHPAHLWLNPERHTSSSGAQHNFSLLSLSLAGRLEPLVEPPFPVDSSNCPNDRSTNRPEDLHVRALGNRDSKLQQQHQPVPLQTTVASTRFGLRGPLHPSASADSALQKQNEIKAHHSTQGLSCQDEMYDHSSMRQPPEPPTTNPDEVAMEWESEASNAPAPHPSQSALPPSCLVELHQTEDRISELWRGLPVEDWSTSTLIDSRAPVEPAYPLPTAIAFDPEMLQHKCLCSHAHDLLVHPESPNRLSLVLRQLFDSRLHIPPHLPFTAHDLSTILQASLAVESPALQREIRRYTGLDPQFWHNLLSRIPLIGLCRLIRARMATEDELCVFHSEDHIATFGRSTSTKRLSTQFESSPSPPTLELLYRSRECPGNGRRKSDTGLKVQLSQRLCKLPCGGLGVDSDTVWNPGRTTRAARLAAGQVLCLAHKVAKREIRNGFALIRPPGHHAEPDQAMGFCYFNSVAVAALHLLQSRLVSRLLILDWDIHHGNGTKLATLHPGLIYISIHRHDGGTFFPGTGAVQDSLTNAHLFDTDHHSQDGGGGGRLSQLINIAWETPAVGDGGSIEQRHTEDMYEESTAGAVADKLTKIDAGSRREIWRQYCYRREHPYRPEPRARDSHSMNTGSSSTGSLFTGTRDSDPNPSACCPCRFSAGGGAGGSSGASSQSFCSLCMSSFASSTQSGAPTAAAAAPFRPRPRTKHTSALFPNESKEQRAGPSPLLGLGDAEYVAATRCVIIPVANEFKPDLILISAGFDAAHGHGEQLGGYSVSPGTFAWITRQCMSVANSRVVLALEGGYVPSVVNDCVTQCLNALLLPAPRAVWTPTLHDAHIRAALPHSDPEGYMDAWLSASDWIDQSELTRPPRPEAVSNILSTMRHHARHGWRCFANVSEENVSMSFSDAIELEQHLLTSQAESKQGSVDSFAKPAELDPSVCNSPLTDGLAQLHMDHR